MTVNHSPHHQDSDNKHNCQLPPPLTTASSSTASSKIDATKRPRTSTACVRCHLKKVRCDGRRPNCDRCAVNDKMCAYPTRRRSRNTQPADVDPFIDDLSHLEQRIRGIESEQEALWHILQQYQQQAGNDDTELVSRLTTIDQHVQTSRASLARQRLLREQHIARNKQHRGSISPLNGGTDKTNPKNRTTKTTKTTSSTKRNKRRHKQQKQQQDQHEQHEQRQQMASTTTTCVSTIQVQPPPFSPWVVNDSPYWFPDMNNEECEYFSAAAAAAATTVQQHHLYLQTHLSTNNELLSPTAELYFDTESTPPHPLLYQSSSTSTVHSSSSASPSSTTPLQSFHISGNNDSNNEIIIDSSPYGLMNIVMNEDPLMFNYPQEGDPWLGHPRL
ncbi:hypothetical protein BDC45DRAFT_605777 [Circinella umbellata]|nr:hypothetical protein BDC45DRAFT_605777 [Circinella umbellata]